MKKLIMSFVVGAAISGQLLAQDFDVQRAMEQVRKENLQRMGVERQQQIVSILRKRAEDLAAIDDAGFTITQDGQLERKRSVVAAPADSGNQGSEGALSSGDSESDAGLFAGDDSKAGSEEELVPAWMAAGLGAPPEGGSVAMGPTFTLRAIIADVAVLDVNGTQKRYRKGELLPGGFTLAAINPRSIEVRRGDRPVEELYIDWSSASSPDGDQSVSGDGLGQVFRTFMQSGQPVTTGERGAF